MTGTVITTFLAGVLVAVASLWCMPWLVVNEYFDATTGTMVAPISRYSGGGLCGCTGGGDTEFDVGTWVKGLRRRDNAERVGDQESGGGTGKFQGATSTPAQAGRLIMAWQTPIMQTNIAAFGVPDVHGLCENMAVPIRELFRELVAEHSLRKTGHERMGANQVFYEYQSAGGGWDRHFGQRPDFQGLLAAMQSAVDQFLAHMGVEEESVRSRSRATEAWASVHDSGVSHLAHTHPNQLISGVFYVQVPPEAGPIIFEDPRGPLPPFDNRWSIYPECGSIVLFPSWLVHQVGPTLGAEERISVAVNFAGSWGETAGVSIEMPLQTG